MHVRIGGPDGFQPDADVLAAAPRHRAEATGGSAPVVADPQPRSTGADVVATDTWVSMGQEDEGRAAAAPVPALRRQRRRCWRAPRQDAIVLHCLPAYRGKEIAAEVIDGPPASSGTRPRTGCTRRRRC